jgi:hypothetical protein
VAGAGAGDSLLLQATSAPAAIAESAATFSIERFFMSM